MQRPVDSTQYTSYAFGQVLDDHRVLGSIGSVGDAYDNAMAESFVDTFKTELIADRVWRTRTQLELAIVEWVAWFNTDRLHESLGDLPPVEFEALHAARIAAITANGSFAAPARRAADGLTIRPLAPAEAHEPRNEADPAIWALGPVPAVALSDPHDPPAGEGQAGASLRSPSGLTPRDAGTPPAVTLP